LRRTSRIYCESSTMIVPNFRGASPVDRHHSSLAKPPRFARRLVYYREAASAVFESAFIDFQGFDPVLKCRGRYPKLDRGSRWSGNPTSALSQHGIDNLPLAARLCLTLESYRRCNPRCRQRDLFGKPMTFKRRHQVMNWGQSPCPTPHQLYLS